ncbi:S-methyl-5-thioribose-1-phosphate isomerase [Papillibacter cinnamivorans]|uniref:Methylthioribose-1-phosphate isomerase n=1 Tax=Papillibacter cinnamivorans DSM 12816 TaxID=1122930 RepID=A0A1W1YJ44_9FIRM|nr:S-methyl-5-thioribose-1-phosphate isomerase [Papillibacter cinnamivorans]SMC36187.1 methylthioribose-1-phosphate isomerase [Papillibacter cinnamivorans DSM 12816]
MEAIRFKNDILYLLDQTKLPAEEVWIEYTDYRAAAEAIVTMVVRGAPAIGITAAYAYFLAAKEYSGQPAIQFSASMARARQKIASTRPTALNLFWALGRMDSVLERFGRSPSALPSLRAAAQEIHREDVEMNRAIGRFGAAVVPQGAGILTHCNAGALATGGYGTALGVIRAAHSQGKVSMVYADETRPLLQGARLTAYELVRDGIPTTLITDSMSGSLMRMGKIQMVVLGADRVAANGDFANKIGTYSVAVLAKHHGIPFYTAMPGSTIDLSLPSGEEIVIEQRNGREISHIRDIQLAPEGAILYNPAFDVTPHSLVTGIITDKGVVYPPFEENLRALFG